MSRVLPLTSHPLIRNIHRRHRSMLGLNHTSSLRCSPTRPSFTESCGLSGGTIVFCRFPRLKHRFQILKLVEFKIVGLLHHRIQNYCLVLLWVRSLGAVALLGIVRLLASLSFAEGLEALLRLDPWLVWAAPIGGLFNLLLNSTEFQKLKIVSLIINLLFGVRLLLRIKIWCLGILSQGLPAIRLLDLFLFEFWNKSDVRVRKWISIRSLL